jgi:hypothetical protein
MLIASSMPFTCTGEQNSFTAQIIAIQVNNEDIHTGTLYIIQWYLSITSFSKFAVKILLVIVPFVQHSQLVIVSIKIEEQSIRTTAISF